MTKNDGGRAFPRPGSEAKYDCEHAEPHEGMSLRDWFAGMTIGGMFANSGFYSKALPESLARQAFIMADAMISERDK